MRGRCDGARWAEVESERRVRSHNERQSKATDRVEGGVVVSRRIASSDENEDLGWVTSQWSLRVQLCTRGGEANKGEGDEMVGQAY